MCLYVYMYMNATYMHARLYLCYCIYIFYCVSVYKWMSFWRICLNVWIYTHTYVHTYIHVYLRIHTHMHTCTHRCILRHKNAFVPSLYVCMCERNKMAARADRRLWRGASKNGQNALVPQYGPQMAILPWKCLKSPNRPKYRKIQLKVHIITSKRHFFWKNQGKHFGKKMGKNEKCKKKKTFSFFLSFFFWFFREKLSIRYFWYRYFC